MPGLCQLIWNHNQGQGRFLVWPFLMGSLFQASSCLWSSFVSFPSPASTLQPTLLHAGHVFQQTPTGFSVSEKSKLLWDVQKQTGFLPHSQYQASPLHYNHFWWAVTPHHHSGHMQESSLCYVGDEVRGFIKKCWKGPKGLIPVICLTDRHATLPKESKTCPSAQGLEDSGENFIRTGKVTGMFIRWVGYTRRWILNHMVGKSCPGCFSCIGASRVEMAAE